MLGTARRHLTLLEPCTICHQPGNLTPVGLDVAGDAPARHWLCVLCVQQLKVFWYAARTRRSRSA